MNPQYVKYGIIAGAVLAAAGLGFGGYKGTQALRRRSQEKRNEARRAAAQAGAAAGAAAANKGAPGFTPVDKVAPEPAV